MDGFAHFRKCAKPYAFFSSGFPNHLHRLRIILLSLFSVLSGPFFNIFDLR